MSKTILMIHGRGFKPPKESLKEIYTKALKIGIKRDYPKLLKDFDNVKIELIYYGDINNTFLSKYYREDFEDKTKSYKETLKLLSKYKKEDFNLENYKKNSALNINPLATTLDRILNTLKVSEKAIAYVAPDIGEYWNHDTEYSSFVRYPMIKPLKDALDNNEDICIISHSLGSIISYDTLWKFSRIGEYRPEYESKKVSLWMTLGSPLGNETVKSNLKGSKAKTLRRYPSNIKKWVNLAAEGDYVCHDSVLANDYVNMLDSGLLEELVDIKTYNLSMREGYSNPHHVGGYLIDPNCIRYISEWLKPSEVCD